MVKVSVILINFNGKKYTFDCIESLKKISFKDFEIIVVDNGSKDGSLEQLRIVEGIRLIEAGQNIGFAAANNLGALHAKGIYVALLNNDTLVEKQWLTSLVNIMDHDQKLGVVMSKIYSKYHERDYVFDGYGTLTLLGFFSWNRKISKNTKKPVDLFFASGCSLLYRKQLVKQPFDDDYFIYAEDTYLSWLLRLKCYQVKMIPGSVVYHEGGAVVKNVKEMGPFFAYLGERNRIMNMLIFYEGETMIKLLPLFAFSLVFNLLYNLKRCGSYLKSYAWLLTHISRIIKKRSVIQKLRKVSDEKLTVFMSSKLFEQEQIKNPILKSIVEFLNALSLAYCKLVNIKTIEDEAKL